MAYGKPVPNGQTVYFICSKCGKQTTASSYSCGGSWPSGMHAPVIPSPNYGGRCPDTSSGNHVWEQC